MADNFYLHQARERKQDEFYTQLTDIEKELNHYKPHFKDKVVYCNCDDPRISNFFVYFSLNFKELGLKKLMTTCYKSQTPDLFSQHNYEKSIYLEYFGTQNENGVPDQDEIDVHYLNGDGDFRSNECIELLRSADIVVTNPPFSLFQEYIIQLIEENKDFLILGQQNAITYKEVYGYIKDKKVWLGVDNGGTKWFEVSPDYEITTKSRQKYEDGKKYFSMGSINWFTNLDHAKRHEELILYKTYTPDEYPRYDNYDAIEVSPYAHIPVDYDGEMGVPITFLSKLNPNQFEIVRFRKGEDGKDLSVNGKSKYFRIVIKRKKL